MRISRWAGLIAVSALIVSAAGVQDAHGQFTSFAGVGQASVGPGAVASGVYPAGNLSLGYGIRNGNIGPGYQSVGGLYGQAYGVSRPQTTVALQPLYSAITSLPGWDGPSYRPHRRIRHRPIAPSTPSFDGDGKILWPSTIPADPAAVELRQAAEAAVQAVVRESKSTGHASIRPVIDAKNKLSAFERKVLPGVKTRNHTDGDALEAFFVDLDRSLDALTYVY
jgi:hypothetical protein